MGYDDSHVELLAAELAAIPVALVDLLAIDRRDEGGSLARPAPVLRLPPYARGAAPGLTQPRVGNSPCVPARSTGLSCGSSSRAVVGFPVRPSHRFSAVVGTHPLTRIGHRLAAVAAGPPPHDAHRDARPSAGVMAFQPDAAGSTAGALRGVAGKELRAADLAAPDVTSPRATVAAVLGAVPMSAAGAT